MEDSAKHQGAPGKTKGTKGGRACRIAIEPALMSLLTAMKEERQGRGLVLPRMPVDGVENPRKFGEKRKPPPKRFTVVEGVA